jgi:hypothetical protein
MSALNWDAASAVEWLELLLECDEDCNDNPETVTLPREVARLVLECAKRGMRKDQGRRGVALSETNRMCQEEIIEWARERKDALRAASPDMKATEAASQAAEEASRLLRQRYSMNLSPSTIMRRME